MTVSLITGCSSGIGLAAATTFARHGHTVVATMRDLTRSTALREALTAGHADADIRTIDVSDDDSVANGVAGVLADYGAIDVIVSNAGIGLDGTTEELSVADFRASFETNVLGNVRLLHAAMPSWREHGGGRFIAVGSMAGVIGQPFNDAYCMSKFAVEGMLESLQPVAAQHGIHVSVVEPGPIANDFVQRSIVPTDRTADSPYAAARARFQILQDGSYDGAQTCAEVAEYLWHVATIERPVLRYQTSDFVAKMVGLKIKDMTGERVTNVTARWV